MSSDKLLKKAFQGISHPISSMSVIAAIIFFTCSNFRHTAFQSTAMDLGFFDQAVYLMSRGELPIVSFWGYHVLGGHADYNLYLIAELYKLYPDARWLLAIQAVSLALGGIFVWLLARQRNIGEYSSITLAISYWLYPLVFNVNLFDFHPEVMAVPGLLAAVWLALKKSWLGGFVFCVVFVLGCKAVISLTVAAMGIWLWIFKRRCKYGFAALVLGLVWFVLATKVVIPAFRPDGVEAVFRYAYLGNSVGEIFLNFLLKPHLILGRLLSWESLKYLAILAFPVIWGLSPRHLAPLLGAFPVLGINLLSEHPLQRTLEHQYSLPILPFLFIAIIEAVATGWKIPSRKVVIAWCVVALLFLGNPKKFFNGFRVLDTWEATRESIELIPSDATVLTDNWLAPHLTHRKNLLLVGHPSPLSIDLETPEYILLNARHPWEPNAEVVRNLVTHFLNRPNFNLIYSQDDVFLFAKID